MERFKVQRKWSKLLCLAIPLVLILQTRIASAQTRWSVVKDSSNIQFKIKELIIAGVKGSFNNYSATLLVSKKDFSDAVFDVHINTNSIHTGINKRDTHLQSADFFDADKYPEIIFKSTAIHKLDDNKFQLLGNLTMHGITKPISLMISVGNASGLTTHDTSVAIFATGILNRKDFGIGHYPIFLIGRKVKIKAKGIFKTIM